MKRKNATRSALFTSIVSLLLCVSMLVGTTFAWFTDSVVSGTNTIAAGNLDVELHHSDKDNSGYVDVNTKLFNDVTLWEPGAVVYENFVVENKGTLALKYQMFVNFTNETVVDGHGLSEALKVAVVEGGFTGDRTAAKALTNLTPLDSFVLSGELEGSTTSQTYGIVIYWEPTANDNLFNMNNGNQDKDLSIDLGINLFATQEMYEEDSFGEDYDKDATYPASTAVNIPEGTASPTAISAGDVTVYVPAGAAEGNYVLKVDNKIVADNFVSYNISLLKDGVEVSGVMYPVEIKIGAMLDIVSLTHNNTAITEYTYDAMQGVISFETDSFSPFTVTYKPIPVTDVEINEDGQIVAGVFEGTNPAQLDASLAAEDSEYIAVSYEADDKTNYVVSKRSTTVVLAADGAADYTAANGNYTVKTNQSGKLWSTIRDLQNNEHTTVYLLPGTYNEGTTINVYSSMDIIGLGDKDAVKVIKAAGASSSNRHLFNCNGSKDEYIQVTLRNLYLDATAKTSNNKDNAAVQAIRRTKVKCYDLTIVKNPTNMGAIAFYVNGDNEVNGEKPAAYLYAENCSLNSKYSFSVATYSGTYKFYYSGLTYNNGTAFTTNNTNVKNQVMEADDWDW